MTLPLIVVIGPDPHVELRQRIGRLCDAHLSALLDLAALRCLLTDDPDAWVVARLAEDEYVLRGLVDGQRP